MKLSTRSQRRGDLGDGAESRSGRPSCCCTTAPKQQKNHYLPRLAKGLEIPCFALTSPEAGSDAASIPDFGIVCKGIWQGKEVLGMRVTWDKRYITLGPVATLLGLAFRLLRPGAPARRQGRSRHHLRPRSDATRPGVNIGRRHLPLNAVFQNGPNSGKDVFMPLDWIIGGQDYAGKGWMMLMGCLAAGRAISLPTSSTRRREGAARAHRRLRARAQPVQDADRQARGRRGSARAHRRATAT